MNQTRESVLDRIETAPGVHFSQLVRDLDIAPGQVQYHVKRLGRSGKLDSYRFSGRTHYYLSTYDDREQRVIAILRRETDRDLVRFLIDNESASPTAVASHLGVARSTLEWHLERLTEYDVVEKRYDERNHVTLTLANPEEAFRFLVVIDPTAPDRLVDRFERLVDQLLEHA